LNGKSQRESEEKNFTQRTLRTQRALRRVAKLSHYGARGEVRMVDVSEKGVTTRTAVAEGFVKMSPAVVRAVKRLRNPKGNPLEVARIAGIAAAKRTAEWIPLCHPLPLTHIDVTARLCQNGVEVRSEVTATAQTGVEMEALVAVTAAALTVYDMCKALDKGMEISGIVLVKKTGGKSGDFFRDAAAAGNHKNNSKNKKTSRSRSR
jgi:cyclic pyranopterin monophosphate synthase